MRASTPLSLGLLAGAFVLGHLCGAGQVVADPPAVIPASNNVPATSPPASATSPPASATSPPASATSPPASATSPPASGLTPYVEKSDYSQRIVAYIHGNIPITREDLGEYLIARHGTDKIDLLVNLRIIEHGCKQRGVAVTNEEIEAAFEEDLVGLNVKRQEFITVFLKQYGKTLYEWKYDVIRPRLLLGKLVREQLKVSDEELKQIYEFRYGRKVSVRLILWPKGQEKIALQQFAEIRKSDADFDKVARGQADATLAAAGGAISPISRNSNGDSRIIEDEAFKLEVGELSRLIETPTGMIVIKCIGHVEPEKNHDFEKEKPSLAKEVIDRKLSREIPKLFAAMKAEAKPQLFLKGNTRQVDVENDTIRELEQSAPMSGGTPTPMALPK